MKDIEKVIVSNIRCRRWWRWWTPIVIKYFMLQFFLNWLQIVWLRLLLLHISLMGKTFYILSWWERIQVFKTPFYFRLWTNVVFRKRFRNKFKNENVTSHYYVNVCITLRHYYPPDRNIMQFYYIFSHITNTYYYYSSTNTAAIWFSLTFILVKVRWRARIAYSLL